jgi:hypothetical protein
MPIQTPQRSLKAEKLPTSRLRSRTAPSASTSRPPAFARTAAELQQHVERLGADKVADILGLRLEDLAPLLAGRVEPTPALLRRLRRASSADTD